MRLHRQARDFGDDLSTVTMRSGNIPKGLIKEFVWPLEILMRADARMTHFCLPFTFM